MDKRTLMAVALAILVMSGYSFIMQKYYPAPKQAVTQTADAATSKTVSNIPSTVSSQNLTEFPSHESIRLSSENVDYELSDIGASIKSINIKKHNNLYKDETVYETVYPGAAIFSLSGIAGSEDLDKAKYRFTKTDNGGEFILDLKNGLQIRKIYALNNGNGLNLEVKIKNTTNQAVKFGYAIVGVSSIKTASAQDAGFVDSSVYLSGKRVKVKPPRTIDSTGNIYIGSVDWAALQGKYVTLVAKPFQKTVSVTVSKLPNNNSSLMFTNETVEIASNETVSSRFFLYSGPVNSAAMAKYQVGIENSVNLGIFGDISKFLLWLLGLFYKIFHNYGVAIILVAILISMVLYPLTLKSFKSMKEMQILQPKIEKLRKEHKDNPQKLNKEIMELYKKHKVNPFGGCLPMILQMPIFIALYQAFSRAAELRAAKFLWIKDLSLPDKAFFIPTGTETGIPVNILPILMAITMFFQQKLSATTTHAASSDKEDVLQQQQKIMTIMMPILFGFIFYNMPSGLVLYWFINTLIMFFQQARIMKSFHVETAIL